MDIQKLSAAVRLDEALDRMGFQENENKEVKARLLYSIREFAILTRNENLEKAVDEKLSKMPEVKIVRGVMYVTR